MKRFIKKIVSTVLACAVMAGMTQGMVFAETTVAQINEEPFETLQAAVDAAEAGETVVLLANVDENVTIAADKDFTLDLNGYTLDGGTTKGKAALTNNGTVTIVDNSADGTGTIKRSDDGPTGCYYTIYNEGIMTIKSGNICNNAGSATAWSGSSLICNGARQSAVLNIKGGTFSQDHFIAVKNDECGTLNISGGEIASLTQAVQNWCKAKISGGDLTGDVTSWTYLNTSAETIITGGTIDGSVQLHKLTYSNTPATNIPVTKISGTANVKGAFFVGSRIWGEETSTADPDAGNLTISGGTFASDPSAYLADGYRVTGSAGNFEVSETPPYIPPVPDQGDDKDEGTTDPSNPEDMPEDGFGTDSEGDTYFFKDGRMVTGWVEQDGTWYYMDEETGVMNTEDWVQVNGTWYNFNENGEMQTGWQKINGIWYYMKDWGGMTTGWQWINGVWYYFYSWGGMATSWVYDNGAWYYMKDWGGMATGWQQVNGKWYYLYANGVMAANTTVEGYVLGADGAMK